MDNGKQRRIIDALAAYGELSAADLMTTSGLVWSFYPTVMGLERRGQIRSRWGEHIGGPWSPRRRLYSLPPYRELG